MYSRKLKKGGVTAENRDIISDLPEDVKHKILSYLRIKDAVRTSILSNKWRYVWASMPKVVLGDGCVSSSVGTSERCSKFIKFVDLVLLLHTGPIHRFKLSTRQPCHEGLDRWMLSLSRNRIVHVTLKLISREKYKIPSHFFSCHDLEYVCLYNCIITLPQTFKGFRLLKTLEIENFTVGASGIESFVTGCPLLEYLSLKKFTDLSVLKIHAAKLRKLFIVGEFLDLVLQTPQLVVASIALDTEPDSQTASAIFDCRNSTTQPLCSLPFIEKLGIRTFFATYLGYASLLKELPVPFYCLKEMYVDICFGDCKEAAAVIYLLQNAPKIEILHIVVVPEADPVEMSVSEADDPPEETSTPCVWNKISTLEHGLKHLHTVNIGAFKGSETVLAFVEPLLGAAPSLEELTLIGEQGAEPLEPAVFIKLLSLKRASNKAKVICR